MRISEIAIAREINEGENRFSFIKKCMGDKVSEYDVIRIWVSVRYEKRLWNQRQFSKQRLPGNVMLEMGDTILPNSVHNSKRFEREHH